MIELIQKQNILIAYLREGRSQREIARMTGVDRKTIRKYINEYEKRMEELGKSQPGEGRSEMIDAIVAEPKYRVGQRPKRKVTEEMEQRICSFLAENEERVKKGQHKQLRKPMDIYETLAEEGVDISYRTVLRTIRTMQRRTKEAYIKGVYNPGDICEFDWGEVKLFINGKLERFQLAVFATAYGNYRFAYLFTKQTTECFQEAHTRFFAHTNGVYHEMVYDNMRVAVKRFVGTEKEPTQGLLQLSIYYGFTFRFCNIRSGNEKGHVERSVEVVRRKAFSARDTFETLEEANLYLQEICNKINLRTANLDLGLTAKESFDRERQYLLPAKPAFDAARIEHPRVDKYSTIMIDQNRYSVPDHLVGEQVMVKVYSNRVICFYKTEKIAEHKRLTGNHEWHLELTHYLETLKKKPGALPGSLAMQQAEQKIKNIYEAHYTHRDKDFVALMQYLRDKEASLAEIERAIESLCQIHKSHVTTDKIKVVCAKRKECIVSVVANTKETKEIAQRAKEQMRQYSLLFETSPAREVSV